MVVEVMGASLEVGLQDGVDEVLTVSLVAGVGAREVVDVVDGVWEWVGSGEGGCGVLQCVSMYFL